MQCFISYRAEALRLEETVIVVAELVAADFAVIVDLGWRADHCQGEQWPELAEYCWLNTYQLTAHNNQQFSNR